MQASLDGAVLLLAAALEQLVSDAMLAYVTELPDIYSNYHELPEAIRSANERLTGEALSSSSYRFERHELHRFVENLGNCHRGITAYTLNGEALALNHRNLTSGTLRNLISRLGIDNVWELMGPTQVLKAWSESPSDDTARSRAQTKLKDLIDTRNDIAHRVGIANPGPDVVRSFLNFEKALARSLIEGLQNHVISLQCGADTTKQS